MGARVGKYKFVARAGKHKVGAMAGKYKLGTRAGKYKLVPRAGDRETQTPLSTARMKIKQILYVIF